jgi:arylsulfatase A
MCDGVDIAPLLFEHKPIERDVYPYYRGSTLYAARLGPWKAHFLTRPGYGPDQATAHDPPQLYHLREDPLEKVQRGGRASRRDRPD